MKTCFIFFFAGLLIVSCGSPVEKFGRHYQETKDIVSLKQAVELIEIGSDTAFVKSILGEPIDMGFDYRYLTDSLGEKGCSIGAVFGLDQHGKVKWKDVFEICE